MKKIILGGLVALGAVIPVAALQMGASNWQTFPFNIQTAQPQSMFYLAVLFLLINKFSSDSACSMRNDKPKTTFLLNCIHFAPLLITAAFFAELIHGLIHQPLLQMQISLMGNPTITNTWAFNSAITSKQFDFSTLIMNAVWYYGVFLVIFLGLATAMFSGLNKLAVKRVLISDCGKTLKFIHAVTYIPAGIIFGYISSVWVLSFLA